MTVDFDFSALTVHTHCGHHWVTESRIEETVVLGPRNIQKLVLGPCFRFCYASVSGYYQH